MIITRYILISLLILQNAYPSIVASKKCSVRGQCKALLKNKDLFDRMLLGHVKEELGKVIVRHSKTLALENSKKVNEDFYTADIPDDVKGIFIAVYNPKKQPTVLDEAILERHSAVYIPKIGSTPSYCEIPLGTKVDILFQRLQAMWKKQCLQERRAQYRAVREKINDLLKAPDDIILKRSSDTPDDSSMIKAKIMNIEGAYVEIWTVPGYGETSWGTIRIPHRSGEPELELRFSSEQVPEEVFSTHLKNIEWSSNNEDFEDFGEGR